MATRKIVNSQGQVTLTVRQNTFTDTTALGGSLAQKPYSPTATVEETDAGVVITIEDVNGRHTATVRNGEKGDRGIQGIPGEAGVSPTVSVSQTESGVELTITDALGQHTATLVNGRDGADGDSPTCSLTEVEGGVELTVVDATGEHAIFIANGHDGAPGERGLPGQKGDKGDPGDDYVLTNEDKAEIAGMVDVPTKVSDLENDAGYLTSHQDISGKADVSDIPTKVSQLTNDAGYISGYTETDPTVPAWAKAKTKPTYTAAEVGALPNTTSIPTKVSQLTNDAGYLTAHQDISGKADKSELPKKVSDLTNDAGFITGYTETDPTVPAWAKTATKPSYTAAEVGALSDVQTNGTSVVVDGVANIPLAGFSTYGVVKVDPNMGVRLTAYDRLAINEASPTHTKEGTSLYFPITPGRQHMSTFYGLAKAAGDTTQAQSNNEIGTYTDEAKAAIRSMLGAVGDTEYATTSSAGVVKVNQSYGILIDDGTLKINSVNTSIKTAVNPNIPVVCSNEHMAVFYGLAKAAGDNTQSSSANAVGVYTDEAKDAIKDMLDVGTVTETISGTTPTITAKANHRYICGEVTNLSFTPCASGICDVRFISGSSVTVLTVPSNVLWPDWFDPAELAANTVYELNVVDGVYGVVGTWAT